MHVLVDRGGKTDDEVVRGMSWLTVEVRLTMRSSEGCLG